MAFIIVFHIEFISSFLDLIGWDLHCYADDVQSYSSFMFVDDAATVRELSINLKNIISEWPKNFRPSEKVL